MLAFQVMENSSCMCFDNLWTLHVQIFAVMDNVGWGSVTPRAKSSSRARYKGAGERCHKHASACCIWLSVANARARRGRRGRGLLKGLSTWLVSASAQWGNLCFQLSQRYPRDRRRQNERVGARKHCNEEMAVAAKVWAEHKSKIWWAAVKKNRNKEEGGKGGGGGASSAFGYVQKNIIK